MLDLKERINIFEFDLYDDLESLINVNYIFDIVKSTSFYNCKYYLIKHDKDIEKNGELKKVHYHLLVKLENAISIEKILKCFYNENEKINSIVKYLNIIKSFKGYVRYLIHYDDKDKYQYNVNDIITNDKNLLYYFNDNTIVDNLKQLYLVIKENNISSFKELINYCINNNDIILMQYIQDNAYLVNCVVRG